MRMVTAVLLLTVIGNIGCESRDAARRRAAKNNLEQLDRALKSYHNQLTPSQDQETAGKKPTDSFSHVIATEIEYYTSGPQQARPPDGKFPAGTKVNIIRRAGSYTQVRSEGGVEAAVVSDAIKELKAGENHP